MLSAVSTSSTDVAPSPCGCRASVVDAALRARRVRVAAAGAADGSPSVADTVGADGSRVIDTIVTAAAAAPASSTLPTTIGMRALRAGALWGRREASRARSSNVAGTGGTRSASSSVLRMPSRGAVRARGEMRVDSRAFGRREACAAMSVENRCDVVAAHVHFTNARVGVLPSAASNLPRRTRAR